MVAVVVGPTASTGVFHLHVWYGNDSMDQMPSTYIHACVHCCSLQRPPISHMRACSAHTTRTTAMRRTATALSCASRGRRTLTTASCEESWGT